MKWINVDESLPPLLTQVLAVTEESQAKHLPYDAKMKVVFLYERLISDYESEENKNDVLRWSTFDNVTHCMPLPEKPE